MSRPSARSRREARRDEHASRPPRRPSGGGRAGVALYGPTSSSKTALSLDVADAARIRGLRPVVLNADSRQIYRGMDIGTSKITEAEMRGVEHRLLDIADPTRKLTLERYLEIARGELEDLSRSADVLPIVVGGTATFVTGLIEGWNVTGSGRRRRELEAEFPPGERDLALRMLACIDRGAAAKVHPNNYEAILNALVRAMGDGESTASSWEFFVVGIDWGASATEQRLAAVLRDQLGGGLLDEIAWLDERLDLRNERSSGRRARSVVLDTHGYREFIDAAVEHGVRVDQLDGQRLEDASADVAGRLSSPVIARHHADAEGERDASPEGRDPWARFRARCLRSRQLGAPRARAARRGPSPDRRIASSR